MGDPCLIRPARLADLDAIVAIEQEAFGDPWPRAMFHDLVGRQAVTFLVAAVQGQVGGYGIAQHVLDEGEIQNLAVTPSLRGRGLGHALVARLIETLAGADVQRVFLEVRASNRAARGLYAGFGFVQVSRRHGYYQRPREDALVLMKEIGTGGVSLIDKRT